MHTFIIHGSLLKNRKSVIAYIIITIVQLFVEKLKRRYWVYQLE